MTPDERDRRIGEIRDIYAGKGKAALRQTDWDDFCGAIIRAIPFLLDEVERLKACINDDQSRFDKLDADCWKALEAVGVTPHPCSAEYSGEWVAETLKKLHGELARLKGELVKSAHTISEQHTALAIGLKDNLNLRAQLARIQSSPVPLAEARGEVDNEAGR